MGLGIEYDSARKLGQKDMLLRRISPSVFAIGLISLTGLLAVLYGTRWGIGISPDSVLYIMVARNLSSGLGLSWWSDGGVTQPLTHYPPLYPILLAGLIKLHIEPVAGARWMNAALFAANIASVGFILRKCARGSHWTAVLGSFLTLITGVMLEIHFMAWSEPLFIFCSLWALFFLNQHLGRSRTPLLVAAACLISLAWFTRYIGISLVITGAIGILLLSQKPISRRLGDLLSFGVVSAMPMMLWLFMNAMRTGNSADRQIAFHPIGLPHLKTLVASLITWLIPQAQLNQVRAVLFLLAFFVFLGSGFYVWRRRIYNFNDLRPIYLPLFFILVYLFSLGISISFFDAQSTFKGRFLSPVWLAAVIILLYLIDRLLFLVKCPRAFKVFIVCVLLFVTGANLQFGISWIWQAHELGLGYSSPNWAQSGLIARIRALPMDIPIYSNGSDVIYFFTGRHTYDLPLKISYTSLQTNQAYTTELHNMKAKLTGEKGVLVIFDAFRGRTYLPAEDELKAEIPMQLLFKAEDGVMYGGLNGPSN